MKPEPINTRVICSVCGLDWDKHLPPGVKIEKCVELLKAELAKRPKGNPYLYQGGGFGLSYAPNVTGTN